MTVPIEPLPTQLCLPDLGTGSYNGYQGGLYLTGSNQMPAAIKTYANNLLSSIQPLDSSGNPSSGGKIVLLSIGFSNVLQEFYGWFQHSIPAGTAPNTQNAFLWKMNADPTLSTKVVLVNGAQGGIDASGWALQVANFNPYVGPTTSPPTWPWVSTALTSASVTAAQVQVVFGKMADLDPGINDGTFPASSTKVRDRWEIVARQVLNYYPNCKLLLLSSRTHSFTNSTSAENPEPYAFENGFSVQWAITDQYTDWLNSTNLHNLNFDSNKGTVVAPLMMWGPYLWATGNLAGDTPIRSDGNYYWGAVQSNTCNDLTTSTGTSAHPTVSSATTTFLPRDHTGANAVLHITGGTGWITGTYPIQSDSNGTATLGNGPIASSASASGGQFYVDYSTLQNVAAPNGPPCSNDYTHPNNYQGTDLLSNWMIAWFKSHPLTTPWLLKTPGAGAPALAVSPTSQTISPGQSITFNLTATQGSAAITQYAGHYDDSLVALANTSSLTQSFTKKFPANGIYNVRFAVSDANGNMAFATSTITVGSAQAQAGFTDLFRFWMGGVQSPPLVVAVHGYVVIANATRATVWQI